MISQFEATKSNFIRVSKTDQTNLFAKASDVSVVVWRPAFTDRDRSLDRAKMGQLHQSIDGGVHIRVWNQPVPSRDKLQLSSRSQLFIPSHLANTDRSTV